MCLCWRWCSWKNSNVSLLQKKELRSSRNIQKWGFSHFLSYPWWESYQLLFWFLYFLFFFFSHQTLFVFLFLSACWLATQPMPSQVNLSYTVCVFGNFFCVFLSVMIISVNNLPLFFWFRKPTFSDIISGNEELHSHFFNHFEVRFQKFFVCTNFSVFGKWDLVDIIVFVLLYFEKSLF